VSIAEVLGVEDNPFGLFLILILLLGATGHFDPAETETGTGAASEGQTKPSITLPVWQTRPKEDKPVRPFSGPRPEGARSKGAPVRKKDLPSAFLNMLGLTAQRRPAYGLSRALGLRSSRHPLLRLWHKMQQ